MCEPWECLPCLARVCNLDVSFCWLLRLRSRRLEVSDRISVSSAFLSLLGSLHHSNRQVLHRRPSAHPSAGEAGFELSSHFAAEEP